MPVIHLEHPSPAPPPGLLAAICDTARSILDLPPSHAWAFWVPVDPDHACRPDWRGTGAIAGPLVRIRCRSLYSPDQRRALMTGVAVTIARGMAVPIDSLFVLLDPVEQGRVMARGAIWGEDG